MASFADLRIPSSATRDSNLFSSVSLRSDSVFNVSRRPFRCPKSVVLPVKAMGVMKFKGTQMREKHLTEMIEKKVIEAKEVCEGDQNSDECKVAWDEVEEVSQAKADLRRKMEKQDPLESFCNENPETDECRIYED